MGLDGFSMSNLGLNRNLTSAQLANVAEDTARQSLEHQIADVDGVGKREKVGKKDEDAAFNGTVPFIGKNKEDDEESQEDMTDDENQNVVDSEAYEIDEEEKEETYRFKYNSNGLIEIWDISKNALIKTITPEEAANVCGNFSKVPGILVNREI